MPESNPFDAFKSIFGATPGVGPFTHSFTPEPAEPADYSVDEHTFPVVIECKVCGDDCLRSWQEEGAPWVHAEERIFINSLRSNYDHEAQPDYIDAEVSDDHDRSSNRPVSGGPAPGVPTWVHRNP